MQPESGVEVDRPFTIVATFISLGIGLIIAIPVGVLLLSLRQPLNVDQGGNVSWSFGMILLPVAALVTVIILIWAVFHLPVVLAKRRSINLDPEVWPATGAIAIGIMVAIAFVLAILFRVI
jgi:hypothetical protein